LLGPQRRFDAVGNSGGDPSNSGQVLLVALALVGAEAHARQVAVVLHTQACFLEPPEES